MQQVFIVADNIISSLGFDTSENFRNIAGGITGIRETSRLTLPGGKVYASLTDTGRLDEISASYLDPKRYTKLEKMIISSVHNAVDSAPTDITDPETIIILSTVKGNNDLIAGAGPFEHDRIHLWKTASLVREHFGNPNNPVVISSACISGTLAVVYAARLLKSGRYKNAIVCGADVVSQFIVSGFDCLKAVDYEPCRPFDASRRGLSPGEGAATIVLSSSAPAGKKDIIEIAGGSSSNDANHISGPSRTGEGLMISIKKTLRDSGIDNVDFINAHGTGTLFNDEMESIAFSRCGLEPKPVNSLKGYLGHTMGASGVIETVLCCRSVEENTLVRSLGFENQGTSVALNMIKETSAAPLETCLKTSSGFGGTNATLLISKFHGKR